MMGAYGLWGAIWALVSLVLLARLAPAALVGHLAPAAVCAALAAVTAPLMLMGLPNLLDALRPGAALIIDEAGLEDRRQKLRLNWSDVSQAEIRGGVGMAAVALRTREGRRTGLLHAGAFWRPGDQIVVRLLFLDPSPRLAGATIARLAERHGAEIRGERP